MNQIIEASSLAGAIKKFHTPKLFLTGILVAYILSVAVANDNIFQFFLWTLKEIKT